jgi:hypothetical protein
MERSRLPTTLFVLAQALLTQLVVDSSLLGITQDLVSPGDQTELALRLLIFTIFIGMILFCEPQICSFHFALGRVP